MFCEKCGSELDANNNCTNPNCSSKINNFNTSNNLNSNYNANSSYESFNDSNDVDRNGITRREMSLFLGYKNAGFYLYSWEESKENPNFTHWNWAAFLFGWQWCFYRKLYALGGIIVSIPIVLSVLALLTLSTELALLTLFVVLGIKIFCGLKGNSLYIKHCVEKIKAIKTTFPGLAPQLLEDKLIRIGGASWPAVIISYAIFYAIMVIIALVITIVNLGPSFYHY